MGILQSQLALGAPIGSGFFGKVYQASDPVLGRVAVKVFQKESGEDDSEWQVRKAKLLKEGQRLREAEHDNVVRVFQVLESSQDDSILLVMECCENGSLQDQFEQGPMLLEPLRNVLTEAALGLQVIHLRGMIHRDIKPSNILLDCNGRAKIADFGLVTDDILLGYASRQGYTDHLAIETFYTHLTSVRTDVWAFGMTVYRLLHGKEFYEEFLSPPRFTVPNGGFAKRLPWLPHVPQAWRRFVRAAMHDDPGRRLQSAVEILQRLESLPIEPDWYCEYSGDTVRWRRSSRTRRIDVIWTKHSARKHEWEARSYPIGAGREYRLGGSDSITGKRQTVRELEEFFRTRG
jgi:serine/threonine protein kinase